MQKPRIVVLVSGSGSNLQALLDHGNLGGDIVLVASDNASAFGLQRAEEAGIATANAPFRDHSDRGAWERALRELVAGAQPDLVVLAGFMKILSAEFVATWPTVNVHPSLLPAFAGAHAPADALAWGVKLSGVTVHYVDEEVDHGPIIAQRAVPVLADDTEATLHARIQAEEHTLLPEVVEAICHGRVHRRGRHVTLVPPTPSPQNDSPQRT